MSNTGNIYRIEMLEFIKRNLILIVGNLCFVPVFFIEAEYFYIPVSIGSAFMGLGIYLRIKEESEKEDS